MRTVAKGFVLALAATAEADNRSACEAELLSHGVEDFEIAFNADGAVVVDCNFGFA